MKNIIELNQKEINVVSGGATNLSDCASTLGHGGALMGGMLVGNRVYSYVNDNNAAIPLTFAGLMNPSLGITIATRYVAYKVLDYFLPATSEIIFGGAKSALTGTVNMFVKAYNDK